MVGTAASDILPLRIEFNKNGEWVEEPKAIIPIKWQKQLNEALDVGEFIIMCTTESEPIPPFTKMRIIEGENDEQITYWYANSQVELFTKQPPYLYKHYVTFVEPTKILETITTGGELLTQPTTGTKKTMFDYFDILLAVNPLRTTNEPQAIKVDNTLIPYLNSIEAREFTTNHNTLLEAIVEGAQFIHAYPRMTDYSTLSFDFFGEVKEYLENDKYFTWRKGQNPNEYCTALEVQAQNVIDTEKTMWYPSQPGIDVGITVRSETTDLTTESAELILPFPIYEVKQIKVWGIKLIDNGYEIIKNAFKEENSLTISNKRIVEREAYQAFANYNDDENSQSAHWSYTRFNNIISGFGTRAYGGISENYRPAWWNTIVKAFNAWSIQNADNKEPSLGELKFKVEYIPISNPRLRAEYLGKNRPQTAVSFDNQSQNIVDVKALGENLKSKIARFGNKAIEKTTIYKSITDIPKIGTAQVVDGQTYILEIQTLEYKNTYYKATNVFTKDFSRLSAYIGLNQQRREYELPTSLVADRKLYRGEYFCVSLDKFPIVNPSINYGNTAVFLRSAFKQAHSTWKMAGKLCTGSFVTTRDKNDNVCGNFYLPTTAKATGNSILFEFGFESNLSAGKRIEGQWTKGKSASLNIPYCDENGEIEKLQIVVAADMRLSGINLNADNLPLIDYRKNTNIHYPSGIFNFLSKQWIIKKDARNKLSCNFQIHYVGLDGLVVGQGLIKYCALINESAPSSVRCYVLPKPLNELRNNVIDLTGATLVTTYALIFDSKETEYNKYDLYFTSSVDGKAWVLVTQDDELIVGGNKEIVAASYTYSLYFAETAVKP